MFLWFFVALGLAISMAFGLNDMFHQIVIDGGILAPRISPHRLNAELSWIVWLVLTGGVGLMLGASFFYLRFGVRRSSAIILIMNNQGVTLWQLKPRAVIPWADIEGYELTKLTTSLGILICKVVVFKVRNKERYLKSNWWGGYPALEVRMFGATETAEAVCQCLDEYLHKNKWPASPEAERNA